MYDNRIFNVNGQGKQMLVDTLRLAFAQEGSKTTATSYVLSPKYGMILLWYSEGKDTPFPSKLGPDAAANLVWEWLESKTEDECREECKGLTASNLELSEQEPKGAHWDEDYEHDGSNSLGWRVYCEDWGHVGGFHSAIVAIKPVFLWHGK